MKRKPDNYVPYNDPKPTKNERIVTLEGEELSLNGQINNSEQIFDKKEQLRVLKKNELSKKNVGAAGKYI